MSEIQTSIIIPVYNKWELTRNCLKSLAETLPHGVFEVFVIDNASSDETMTACPALGRALFGDAFHYHRSEKNLNFGPANNLAAEMAKGKFLILLNNDTAAKPGWYHPLLDDFTRIDNLGATGPLLVYPPSEPFGETVQHLGVSVNPMLQIGHLYEGIPAQSQLARKRRFFQAITAACMVIPRSIFWEMGGFDEGYVNGFEDVDLCAKLKAAGYFLTVNPESAIVHYASQSPGRKDREEQNSKHFANTTQRLLVPDLNLHLENDGFSLGLTKWLTLAPEMPAEATSKLTPLLTIAAPQILKDVLTRHPLWLDGYLRLAEITEELDGPECALKVWELLAMRHAVPDHRFRMLECAQKAQANGKAVEAFIDLLKYCHTFDLYRSSAEKSRLLARIWSLTDLAGAYDNWLAEADNFRNAFYLPYMRKMRALTLNMRLSSLQDWTYALWHELVDVPRREAAAKARRIKAREKLTGPSFSILMPVYNPDARHLREAVASVIGQDWPDWELCMADDASTDPNIRPMLENFAASDPRIQVRFRATNGNISAASNTALEMARHEYAVLMDQDDLLTPDALSEVARAIQEHPDGKLFYSDEDKVKNFGGLSYPHLKGEWDPELILGQNYISHLGVYMTGMVRSCGAFREGFEGAQDHDLVLRYTQGLSPEEIIHIPRVLYHWRSHELSTAASVDAKPQAVVAGMRSVREHLDRTGVAGEVELIKDCGFYRVRRQIAHPAPLVSLIVDLGDAVDLWPAISKALFTKSSYAKFEALLLCDSDLNPSSKKRLERDSVLVKNVSLFEQKKDLNAAEKLNCAIEKAQGEILGILGRGIVPESVGWLNWLAAHLRSERVGATGGKIISGEGRIHHLGHAVTADRKLFSILRGLPTNSFGWFGWTHLARTVASLDPRCVFLRRKDLLEDGGLDPEFGSAALIDFCLKIRRQKRLRTVVDPNALFRLASPVEADWEDGAFVANERLCAKWRDELAPHHPDLASDQDNWTLCHGQRQDRNFDVSIKKD